MASAEKSELNGGGVQLDKFLKERQKPNPSREQIVNDSHKMFKETRQNSADADCLSKSQKAEKLEDFLRKGKRRLRKRSKKLTISDVRAEAAKILEEFLEEQLAQQAIQTSSPEYQRVLDISVTENTTPSGDSSSYLASSGNILREDSIPYADESDGELKKAESLPHDEFVAQGLVESKKGLPIHHEKSRSAPHSENMWIQSPSKKPSGSIRPPPPPPPGTPHSPSENSSNGSYSRLQPVPYTGKRVDSSVPCSTDSLDNITERKPSLSKKETSPAPDSLELPTSLHSNSRSTSTLSSDTGARQKTFTKQTKPGSETSSDTDSDSKHHMHGKKKKSMFKKAQHRVQSLLRLKKHRESHPLDEDEEDGYDRSEDARPKHRKKYRKHDKEKQLHHGEVGDRKVLEERHIHRNKHIHQTHSGDNKSVLRSEDTTETIDIVNSKETKHIEKHWKMKESSANEGGVLGRLKRLTLRDKGRKSHIKESKSAQFDEDEADGFDGSPSFTRALSVPVPTGIPPTQLGLDETDDAHLTMYTDRQGFEYSSMRSEEQPGTRHVTATQVVCRDEKKNDIRRHSSHFDIVDHSGNMVERLLIDGDGNELPKNESFILNREEDIIERVVDDHGRKRLIRHVNMSQDSETAADKDSQMTEEEKHELYGKVASRLATIGDNLNAEMSDQSRSASASSQSKLSDEQKSSPEQEIARTTLTPLEIEIRDELRRYADSMDEKLAGSARQAALHIGGMVTNNHFQNVLQESVSQEEGWAQVAAVFHVTKQAVKLAGKSGAVAMKIKEMSLKYFEDTFASWVVEQGGWESMLSDDETDSELD